jgi:hypothetical protein
MPGAQVRSKGYIVEFIADLGMHRPAYRQADIAMPI